MIDVGTNNNEVLCDPSYIGLPEPRLRGDQYDALLDEFMAAAAELFPRAMIQFEDFGNLNAFRLLERYRNRYCMFSDDIQGTASMTLAGLYSALRMIGGKLSGQRFVVLGAGEAALGIGSLLVSAMVEEGLSEDEARGRCWFVDSKGLVVTSRTDLSEHKRRFAQDYPPHRDLLSVVEAVKPTAIIGASGQPSTFTPAVLEAMARINKRPIVFALSNPTSQSECTAEEAYRFTDKRAVFASGSQFPPVVMDGQTFVPGQANNSYIFPGVGLGILASEASRVTDEMFAAAAKALDAQVSEEDFKLGRIYPSLARIREVSLTIALAVARVAYARRTRGDARTGRSASAISKRRCTTRPIGSMPEAAGIHSLAQVSTCQIQSVLINTPQCAGDACSNSLTSGGSRGECCSKDGSHEKTIGGFIRIRRSGGRHHLPGRAVRHQPVQLSPCST